MGPKLIRSIALTLFVFSIAFNSSSSPSQQQQPEPQQEDVVRISTTLVTVPVKVRDRHGKTIQNLGREDFHIFEDGVEQKIAYFETPEEAKDSSTHTPGEKPLTVALLLDNSDSTQFKLQAIKDAATAFINQLRPEDRILLVAFDKNVRVLTEQTVDRNALREAVRRMQPGGGTSLYDALESVIAWLARISGPKAIVLLTDGVDTASAKATYESTVRAAQQLDAAIYVIQYNTYADFADSPSRQTSSTGEFATISHATKNGEPASEAYKRATLFLRLLADKTGGQYQLSDSVKNLSRSFTKIAAQLREQYTLGYYPSNKTATAKPRKIKVTVDKSNVDITARKTYVYAP